MKKLTQQLQYTIVSPQNYPGEGKLTNIISKRPRRYNMNIVESSLIFNITFTHPSKVFYVHFKGYRTHTVQLTFYDPQHRLLMMKSVTLAIHDQEKILDVWERPLTKQIQVRLVNNPSIPMLMGLEYLGFEGQAIKPKPDFAKSLVVQLDGSCSEAMSQKALSQSERKPIFETQKEKVVKNKIMQIDLQGDNNTGVVEESVTVGPQVSNPRDGSNDIYYGDQTTNQQTTNKQVVSSQLVPIPEAMEIEQPIIIDQKSHSQSINHSRATHLSKNKLTPMQQDRPLQTHSRQPSQFRTPSHLQLENHSQSLYNSSYKDTPIALIQQDICQSLRPVKGYVTYQYDPRGEWWDLMKRVNKQWVQTQSRLQIQKGIKQQDRMSQKIQVRHMFKKKVRVQGLQPQRQDMLQMTARMMGALILNEVEAGCLVVTSRQYGDKIRRMKKYKDCFVVTQEFVLNCKRFNQLLNHQDYRIR